MKIGIDIRTLLDQYYSGISEYTLNLVNSIVDIDRNNEHVLFYNSAKNMENKIPMIKRDSGELILRYPNKVFNLIMQKLLKYPKIDNLMGADVFFMPHFNFISLSKKVKKIITIHDLSFLRYPEFFSWRKNAWHKAINVKKLLSNFDKIVAVSENTRDDLIELCKIPENKIEVIYSGIGEEYKVLKKEGDDLIKMNKIAEKYSLSDNFILSLCNLEPRKNISATIKAYDLLLQKYSDFDEYDLVIAGAKAWKNKDIIKTWKSAKNKDRIKFIGYVEKEEKVFLYNMASLFIYPSFYEGFGFPPLEAYYCGAPVIVSNNSSLPEIIGDKAILINPFNISELMIGMKETLAIKNTNVQINTKYLWKNTANQYVKLFEKFK